MKTSKNSLHSQGIGNRCNSRQMASHLSVLSYLTRSITLSLGAELTGSSLIMMISSPGISLPSDGPPANTHQTGVKWYKLCTARPFFLIFLVSCLVAQGSNKCLLIERCSNQWIIGLSWVFLSLFWLHFSGVSYRLGNVLLTPTDPVSHCCIRACRTTGALYLVWLSGPPQVSHCLPQIQSRALGLVSSPPSGELEAQTCPRPGEPPPRSCSGTRGCGSAKRTFSIFCTTTGCICYTENNAVTCSCEITLSESKSKSKFHILININIRIGMEMFETVFNLYNTWAMDFNFSMLCKLLIICM